MVGGEVNVVDLLYQKEIKARYTKLELKVEIEDSW
jgi:hypothetical protein